MSKYYEKTKSNYSRDINHLINFNNNGIWIKENLENGYKDLSPKYNNENLNNVLIFNFDENFKLKKNLF